LPVEAALHVLEPTVEPDIEGEKDGSFHQRPFNDTTHRGRSAGNNP
jgi:hypothetical protein